MRLPFTLQLAGVTLLGCLMAGGMVAAADSAAEPAALPSFDRMMVPVTPKSVSDFALTDQDGRSFHFSSLQGQPALVFFGFAQCPDVCPTTLAKLRLLKQTADGAPGRVPVLMISVDGERDTPQAMKDYLAHFSADFVGLTGDPGTVRGIAAQFSAVFFKGQPRDASGSYDIEHTSRVYAVDKSGRVRAEFYDASVEAMQSVTDALLKESPGPG